MDFRNILHSNIAAFYVIVTDLLDHNVMEYSEKHIIDLQPQRKFRIDMYLYVIMMKVKYDSPKDTRRIVLARMTQYTEYFSVLIPQMMELCKKFVVLI